MENSTHTKYRYLDGNKIKLSIKREVFDIKKLKNVDKIHILRVDQCVFPDNEVDFSAFTNCRKINLIGKNPLRVVKWPPKIESIWIRDFPNLKIPLKCDQYQYLKEFDTTRAVLDDYNIDFAHCYRLRKISLSEGFKCNINENIFDDEIITHFESFDVRNIFDGEKITLPPKNDGKHRMKKVPLNWARCISLKKLRLSSFRELKEIPIEFTHNPRLWIRIVDTPHIPHISFLPIEFWDCTTVGNYDDFMYFFDSVFHPRLHENLERYEEWENHNFEIEEKKNIAWKRNGPQSGLDSWITF